MAEHGLLCPHQVHAHAIVDHVDVHGAGSCEITMAHQQIGDVSVECRADFRSLQIDLRLPARGFRSFDLGLGLGYLVAAIPIPLSRDMVASNTEPGRSMLLTATSVTV